MAYDQLDNAMRLKKLGVADILPPKRFTGSNLAEMLGRLLTRPSVSDRADHWSAEMKLHDPLTETCVELEKLSPASRVVSTPVTTGLGTSRLAR
jgi:rhamnosyltransferase subunit B